MTRDCEFDWDVYVETGNKQKATHFFSDGYVLNKDTKIADAAFDFAAFLCTSKETAQIRLDNGWGLSPTADADFIKKYLALTPPANRQAIFDSIQYLVTPPVVEDFQLMQDTIVKYLDKARLGELSVKDALDACQKDLEGIKIN